MFSRNYLKYILSQPDVKPFILLETAHFDKRNYRSFIFNSFQDILTLNLNDNLNSFFKRIDDYLKKGFWLAGYFSYEFGYLLEQKLYPLVPKGLSLPLAWLGVFKNPVVVNHREYNPISGEKNIKATYQIKNLQSNITEKEYNNVIKKIKNYIQEGQTYQVNFTFKLKFDFEGDPVNLYLNLRRVQPTSYMAFINTGKDFILSFSPELFFHINQGIITTKPMKGTLSRGRFLDEDGLRENLLHKSVKNRAENLMIVDLLRNDLGRVAKKGTVIVKKLFSIEKYLTVLQMTSTIEANLKRNASLKNILSALFPSGSVTGAPKIRTMQIIRELEREPRNVYTGAIGYISPHHEVCFNVAIRTIHIDKRNKGSLGIGGGIVYDSIDKKEYKEAILKAHFLVKKFPNVSLIETIRWQQKGGYYLIDLHLERLKKSCEYFNIPCNSKKINQKLLILERIFNHDLVYKVRLLIDSEGRIRLEYWPLEIITLPLSAKVSSKRVDSKDIYLYHKTTNRYSYEKERKNAIKEGFLEVIFTNQKGQLTEGSFTNIFLLQANTLYTPSLECGLLKGVLREHFLRSKSAREKVLYPQDILKAEKVYLGNSVRGLMEANISLPIEKLIWKSSLDPILR